ncbi:glutathione/cysteine ABC transporter permease/ATPase [Meridianimarinicoccus roseus]|uniref:Glutathione/cysteine ABC transporter permease/ATPase n=1 Tax=Meridianimarinicoccus roseus TaxID=2072018 RepID=A0A2V2LFS4_9RHOB|nr:ATP-binding cassette domain-containing protein [Meridianimarinicoccus roseus]PWR02047.1 glutathione/cysteine ABC transporter permease/ATPase [Meridianimarinicoccus roseus]
MKALLSVIIAISRAERVALSYGLALSIAVLVMGVALLALSGWFIMATAAAGIAGIGVLFNVFAPSAMVRFLALGRTAARYGERVLTHDATLRAVSGLRVALLRGVLMRPHRALEQLRAASELNRITADTEALDGALLRLVLPALAGWITILAASLLLWWLVAPTMALILGAGYLVLPTVIFLAGQKVAKRPARLAEAALQIGRSRMVDLVLGRDDLAVFGQLPRATRGAQDAFDRAAEARRQLDRIDRITGMLLDMVSALVTVGCLLSGIALVQAGTISVATAAIGVFAALALAEAVASVRRALTEIGRMTQAARRIGPALRAHAPQASDAPVLASDTGLEMRDAAIEVSGRPLFRPVSLSVRPGETVVLQGASGSGKSTLLLMAVGALSPSRGQVSLFGADPSRLPMETVTESAVLVTQRAVLISGTVAANLRLAAPEARDDALWAALEATCLADTLRGRGGLDLRLGARGAGLSGGEARRLVLARAILRTPRLLLLDEPTEGLDEATARRVMAGLRQACPDAAFLVAAHHAAERDQADRIVEVARA